MFHGATPYVTSFVKTFKNSADLATIVSIFPSGTREPKSWDLYSVLTNLLFVVAVGDVDKGRHHTVCHILVTCPAQIYQRPTEWRNIK